MYEQRKSIHHEVWHMHNNSKQKTDSVHKADEKIEERRIHVMEYSERRICKTKRSVIYERM